MQTIVPCRSPFVHRRNHWPASAALPFAAALVLAATALRAQQPQQLSPPRVPLPPMLLPFDYTTPQPVKITPPDSLLPASPATLVPMRPAGGMPTYDTSRFTAPNQVRFQHPKANGPLWAGGADWKARFDATGFVVFPFLGSQAPTDYPVHLQLAAATVAGHPIEVAAVAPTRTERRFSWRRGGVTELVDVSGSSLEHSFRFDTLPARGELLVDIAFHSELAATVDEAGVHFRNDLGGLDYSQAIAIDARGERMRLAIELHGDHLTVRVPAGFVEHAALPLTIDPVLVAQAITPGSAWEGLPDLVYDNGFQEWLVVWNRQYSLTDMDVYAQRLDADMNPVNGPLTIDYTTDFWWVPRVANLQATGKYLVVAEVSVDGTATENWWIAGCTIDGGVSGPVGNQFDIEHDGVVGLPGRNFLPAVGGDPSLSLPAYFTVVWSHETTASNSDIHLKQIDSNGNLRSALPTVVDGSPSRERNVDISRSNGDTGSAQTWVIAYQRTFSPVDEDIRGALLSWDGQLQLVAGQYNFPIDSNSLSDAGPHPSSPTDRSAVTNRRFSLVGYSRSNCTGCSGSLGTVSLVDDLGGALAGSLLGSLCGGVLLTNPHYITGVDSDGTRFAVAGGFTDPFFGNADNFITTLAYSPFPGVLSCHELALISTSTVHDEYGPSIAATHSSGAAPVPHYGMTYSFAPIAGGNANIAAGLYVSPLPDECAIAQPLAPGINGPFTTVGSTTSAPAWGCGFNTSWDVWFSYTATTTAPVTFWTCTPTRNFDTVMEVFGGSCGALTSLGCNDDFCGVGSRVSIAASFGTTYYVRVGGFNFAYGAFDVEVQLGTGLGSIARNVHGCGPTTITATGQPHIGGSVTTTLGNLTGIPLVGVGQTLLGVPFCGCTIGHDWLIATVGANFVLNIPPNASLIGAAIATQGADFLGAGGCASPQLTLTDTMVITIG